VVGGGAGVHVGHAVPKAQVRLGFRELQGALLGGGDHGDPSVEGAEHLGLGGGVEPVGEPGEALVQGSPERDPVGHGRRRRHAAEAGDVLVADPAAAAAGLDQACL
jgi:hypothetical protein